jgi:flagellar hook protein FlgE
VAFTRNGQFDIDKDGFVANSQGFNLTGYSAINGVVQAGGEPRALQLDFSDVQPQASSGLTLSMSLNSGDTISPSFDPTNPAPLDRNNAAAGGYNFSTSATVFDTLGNDHTLTYFFVKSAASTWDVHYQVDGTGDAVPLTPAMQFDANGALTAGGNYTQALDFSSVGASAAQAVDMDLTGSTQYGGTFGVNTLRQDGYASGRLTGVTIGKDGVILGRYSNGQSRDLGQVVLANFASPNGLLSLGGNMWAESPDSGQPIVGSAGTANLGLLTAGSLEEANVDLTGELVNLIVQQRAYQANAQSVRAQDQILQTIVNLR